MIQLVRPTEEWKEQVVEFRQEFFDHGEFVMNGSELFDKIEDYIEWYRSIDANTKEETVNPNWVITDTFFAVDDQDRIVGIIGLIWLVAAIVCGLSGNFPMMGLSIVLAGAFLYSAYTIWKKEKDGKGGR